MNKIYALVWNEKTKSLVVASEFAKNCRSTLTPGKGSRKLAIAALALAVVGGAPDAYAYNNGNGTDGGADSIAIGGSAGCVATTDAASTSSIAMGCGAAVTNAPNGVAIGTGATSLKTGGIAIGNAAQAIKESSIAIGTGSKAGDPVNNFDFQIAIGSGAQATAQNSLAIGDQALSSGPQSTAVGSGSIANAAQATAFGRLSSAGNNATAIGMNAKASSTRSTALGQGAIASGTDATSLGQGSGATVARAVAIGRGASATTIDSVALGSNSVTQAAVATSSVALGGITYNFAGTAPVGTVSVGGAGAERTITNLAAGQLTATSTDAVNGSQLFATNQALDFAVRYDTNAGNSVNRNQITLGGGTAGTRITNLAPGVISAASTDAVNGSQLNETNTSVANNTQNIATNTTSIGQLQNDALLWDPAATGGAAFSANHGGTGPNRITNVAAGELSSTSTDAVNGSQLNTTNANVASNTQNIATNTTDIATNTTSIGQLQNDALLWDPAANGGDGAFSATHGGVVQNRITNVAAGELSDTSTDAVNGSQLNETNTSVAGNTQNIATNTADIATNTTSIGQLQNDALLWDPAATGGAAFSANHGGAGPNRITNVAVGELSATSTDAVNGSQLYATNQSVDSLNTSVGNLSDFAVRYDQNGDGSVNRNMITLGGGAAGTVIANVAPGELSDTSTDAVNGSQLNATNTSVAANASNIGQLQNDALLWDPAANGGDGAFSANHGGVGQNRITNVAAGDLSATSTDAVNGSQLYTTNQSIDSLNTSVGSLSDFAVRYDQNGDGSVNKAQITLGGTGGTLITNVAAGELSDASTDAVNGSQLNETNTSVAGNTQNIATNTADIATNTTSIGQLQNDALLWDPAANGGAGAFSATHGGNEPNRITNVAAGELSDTSTDAVNGSQLNATNANVAGNTQNIATNTTSIGQLQNDALLWDASANGGDGAFSATHGGVGQNRITNVAAGELSDTSTDAVNGSQLYTTNQSIDSLNTSVGSLSDFAVRYDQNGDGSVNRNMITLGGGAAGTVIANVAPGELSDTSTQAVNGSQLNETNANVAGNTQNIAANTTSIGQLRDDALLWDASANGGSGAFRATHGGAGPNRITSVAAGELSDTSTDAVNGSQLYSTNQALDSLNTSVGGLGEFAVRYDQNGDGSVNRNQITLGGDGGTRITNVAPGELSDTSTDAVNGSQLNATNTNVAANASNIGQLQNDALLWDPEANGGTGAFSANHGGAGPNRITNVAAGELSDASTDAVNGSQLNATNANVATNTQNIATNTADIATNTGNIGQLQNDALLWDVSANGGSGAFSATHGGVGQNRITNVAAGELSDTSTDAVNGSQLYSTNQALDSLNTSVGGLGEFAVRYDQNGDGSVNRNQITLGGDGGTRITNVAPGELSDASTDAVNGSQLNATNTNVAANASNIGQLQNDALLWDPAANGGTGAFSANHGGAGPNRITNVAAGELSDASTDAVNGSQLNATNTSVATNTQNIATNTADIATNTGDIGQLQNDALLWDASANGGSGAFSATHGGAGPNRITSVAAGELSSASTDAVNGSQLYSTNQALDSLNTSVGGLGEFAVRYDQNGDGSVNRGRITLGGGVAGTVISNMAAGELSATSTDAVNGSQLNATNENVATNTANIAANTGSIGQLRDDALLWDPAANGGGGAFSANHGGAGPNRITNVAAGELSDTSTDAVNGAQLKETNDTVATNTTNIGQLQNDALLWDPAANGGAGAFSANHGGAGPNRITNVAAGELSDASTDAVNGSQLYSTNQTLASLNTSVGGLGDFAVRYDQNGDGSVNRSQITLGGSDGTRITNVAAGELSATSTDAVNGAQLNETNDSVAANTQNIATNTADIATNTGNIGQLRNDALQWDAAANGGSGAFSASHMGSGPSRITNVAAGEVSADSTDAVNGAQLYDGIKGVGDNITTLRQDALLWNETLGAFSASHGTSAASKITNVAAGTIASTSTDAINGSQLYTTNSRVNLIEGQLLNINQGGSGYVSVNSSRGAPAAVGSEAIAIGPQASAAGSESIALGSNAQSSGESAVAMGSGAGASGSNSAAIGSGANASADNAVALGAGSVADRNNTVSVGAAGSERQIANVAAGTEDTDAVNVAQLRDVTSSVTGDITRLSEGTDGMFQVNNTSGAAKPRATGSQALAGGAGSVASGDNSMAVGMAAQATGSNAVALGNGAVASGQNAVALGANSVADRDNAVSVGYAGGERQISHVAAGTMGTDAVNLNQLNDGIKSANQYTNERFSSLKKRIDDNKDKMSAGIAGAMAMASLTQPYEAGASMMSIGTASYEGKSAIALGVSTVSENGRWVTKLSGNSNSEGDMGVGLGVGFQW